MKNTDLERQVNRSHSDKVQSLFQKTITIFLRFELIAYLNSFNHLQQIPMLYYHYAECGKYVMNKLLLYVQNIFREHYSD